MRTTRRRPITLAILWTALAFLLSTAMLYAQAEPQPTTTLHLPAAPGGSAQTPASDSPTISFSAGPVYGVLGTLQAAVRQGFDTYLVMANGASVGLVGETPDVESRIITLRDTQANAPVKVWGVYSEPSALATEGRIVVADIIPADTTAPGIGLPVAAVQFDLVNLRRGPGNRFEHAGQVTRDQACVIINRNQVETWYFVDCTGNVTGWIDRRLVDVRGNTNNVPVSDQVVAGPTVPTPAPQPTPTPSLPPTAYWRGEFFVGMQLAPPAVYSMESGELNFNWGAGSPSLAVPVDGFSARFERTFDFGYGYYRFEARADDGVRIYLDDDLIIDEWHGSIDRGYVIGRALSGRHVVRVEYFEATGNASLSLRIDNLGNEPVWAASYYGGVDLQGVPVLEQRESRGSTPLDYNWGGSSPAPSRLTGDFWSARWVGRFPFERGDYVFRTNSDDGVRVYLDGTKVIDAWYDGYHETSNRFIGVGVGDHEVRVEFYERGGDASLQLWWYKERGQPLAE